MWTLNYAFGDKRWGQYFWNRSSFPPNFTWLYRLLLSQRLRPLILFPDIEECSFLIHQLNKVSVNIDIWHQRATNQLTAQLNRFVNFLHSSDRRRERHAKTLEAAQEEILTCLGLHIYDRLHRIRQKVLAEEQAWSLLVHVGMYKLQKAFEVESYKGIGSKCAVSGFSCPRAKISHFNQNHKNMSSHILVLVSSHRSLNG